MIPRFRASTLRRIRFGRLACWTFVAATAGASVGCGPVWYMDANFGQRLAAEKKKPMLLYFKEWDSSAHRNMKMRVLESSVVKKELTDTVNIEVEWHWGGPLKEKYHVQAAQVCVVCTPDGREVGRITVNPVPAEAQFAKWLHECKGMARGESRPATTREVSVAPLFNPPRTTTATPKPTAVTMQPEDDGQLAPR